MWIVVAPDHSPWGLCQNRFVRSAHLMRRCNCALLRPRSQEIWRKPCWRLSQIPTCASLAAVDIKKMGRELLEANKDYLPAFVGN